MKFFNRLFALLAFAIASAGAHAATIDKMFTATIGHYEQDHQVGQPFMIFPKADYYLLSDGTTWDSGAGSHSTTYASLKKVVIDGDYIRYVFDRPEGGILFQNTDYDSGEHSAQGVLGAPKAIVLVAKAGSTQGIFKGYTTVISNDETWYGQPRFNFYSAAVGEKVYFKQNFVLLNGAVFTPTLFDTNFTYNVFGLVNFLKKK
ncbi:hypothetical protein [Ideonella sp.]|uniref:hypothetical protein n=1 Tax=Ideonella sp. TaxID=1929293 RepID=UPI0035AD9DD2